jgi:hypothetical protein
VCDWAVTDVVKALAMALNDADDGTKSAKFALATSARAAKRDDADDEGSGGVDGPGLVLDLDRSNQPGGPLQQLVVAKVG